jgi:hypothetical protein
MSDRRVFFLKSGLKEPELNEKGLIEGDSGVLAHQRLRPNDRPTSGASHF